MRKITNVIIAWGSNIGDGVENISKAQQKLASYEQNTIVAHSGFYSSIALTINGRNKELPRYTNAVSKIVTSLSAYELLEILQKIENSMGRIRTEKWGDRILDADIIQFGGEISKDKKLVLPHPEAHLREFVLRPWLEVEQDAVLLGKGRVRNLLNQLPQQELLLLSNKD